MATEMKLRPNKPEEAKRYFESKMAFTTGPVELERMLQNKQDVVVVDVREAEDYQKGHIPGAINLPKERWDSLEGLSRDKQNVVYCYSQVCHLAAKAAVQFAEVGFPVMELEGGWKEWRRHDLPVEH